MKTVVVDSSQPELINIGSKKKPASLLTRIKSGTVADKFFTFGALAVLTGIVGLGSHMWYMLTNQMPMASSYEHLKNLHIIIQIYLFFGFFIIGFCFQAGPKLIGFRAKNYWWAILLCPIQIIGCLLYASNNSIGNILLAFTPFCIALTFYRPVKDSIGTINKHALFFLSFALLGLQFTPFLDLRIPINGLIALWLTVVPAIFAAAEQFIVNFLKGTRCKSKTIKVSYLISASMGLHTVYNPNFCSAWAFLTILVILDFLKGVEVEKSIFRPKNTLHFAITLSFFWAIISSLLLLFTNLSYADFSLHIWATGWQSTLIIAISAQIMGFLSGKPFWSSKFGYFIIALWQVVPIGRGLPQLIPLPDWFSWIVGIVATFVIGLWSYKIFQAEFRILNKQLNLCEGERMGSC